MAQSWSAVRTRRTLLTGITVALVLVGASRNARADWYDDAKDIIEQLIEDDIATQAVPTAAAMIPAVCDFLPATVAALEDKRYSGLPLVLRKEISDAIGFVVWRDLSGKVTPLPQRPSSAVAPRIASQTALSQLHVLQQTGLSSESRALAAVQPALAVSQAQSPGLTPSDAALCSFPSSTARAKAAKAQHENKALPAAVSSESKATQAMRVCLPTQKNVPDELACAVALLTRDALDGDDQLLPIDIRRIQAILLANALTEALKPPTTNIFPLEASLAAWLASPTSASEAATSVCTTLAVKGDACLLSVEAALTQFPKPPAADLTTLEAALGFVAAVADSCASGQTDAVNVCKHIRQFATGGEQLANDIQTKNYGAAAGDVVDAIETFYCPPDKDANGRSVDQPEACDARPKTVYRFIRTLAVYSIDSATSSSPTASPEADFRDAAVELIEAYSGSGVRRRLRLTQWLYVPEFSLREGWRPGHVATDPTTQLFSYPSIEMLRIRAVIPLHQGVYWGIHGSVLDPLGPFVEVATRNSVLGSDPKKTSVFFLGFVVPRIDMEFGVPDLTRNLVVGAGAAARGFRANRENLRYCVIGSSCAGETGSSFGWDNFELSAFVKYVP